MRVAQIDLDLAADLGAGIHLRLEEREGAAEILLGARQRNIGVLQQLVGIVAVARRHRNADGGADHDRMIVQQDRDRRSPRAAAAPAALHPRAGSTPLCRIANSSELRRAIASSSRSVERSRFATARNSLSPMAWPSVSLTALKLSSPSTSTASFSALRRVCSSMSSICWRSRVRFGSPVRPSCCGHEGEPRLGALALGDVHQRQQHRRLVAMDELARIDGEIDQRAVGTDVLPGPRRLLVGAGIAEPGQLALEGLQGPEGQFFEFGAAVAVMRGRGVVDAEDALAVERADDHRHRVAVEQQAERGLALLQLGDVDAQADHTAVRCELLLDQHHAAVGEPLLVARGGLMQPCQPFGDPLLLAAFGFRIIAARDADADGVGQPRADLNRSALRL